VGEVEVELINITKCFGKIRAVKGISLRINRGEFFFLVGPSGCGKTTTLRMLAGFDTPDGGEIRIRSQIVNRIPPEKRNTGMVFQNWALFPHKTVFENIAFGLRMRKVSNALIREKVEKTLELIHLPGFGNRFPDQLSGGQKQRVALARALVIEPSVLLLDEPLSNLDAKIREQMRLEISSLLKRLSMTAVYVTHDQAEALAMADRIAVMDDGNIRQVGMPVEIYERPTDEFVAHFIGDTNTITGKIAGLSDSSAEIVTEEGLTLTVSPHKDWRKGERQRVFIRPEKITLHTRPVDKGNPLQGRIKFVTYMGSSIRYHIDVDGKLALRVDEQKLTQENNFKAGDPVFLSILPDNCCCFPLSK
jgi:ABC-type Fe3+/spermidine/putrescine transport system ATPase subunit